MKINIDFDALANDMYSSLAKAFGGYSQVPDQALGQAVVGQCNNGALRHAHNTKADYASLFDAVVNRIYSKWEDTPDLQMDDIRKDVLEGAKSCANGKGGDLDDIANALEAHVNFK